MAHRGYKQWLFGITQQTAFRSSLVDDQFSWWCECCDYHRYTL